MMTATRPLQQQYLEPPFPTQDVNFRELYRMLGQLASFLHNLRKDLEEVVDADVELPEVPELGDEQLLYTTPLALLCSVSQQIGAFRETWDSVHRTERFGSPDYLSSCRGMLASGCKLLGFAYLTPADLAARRESWAARQRATYQQFVQGFQQPPPDTVE